MKLTIKRTTRKILIQPIETRWLVGLIMLHANSAFCEITLDGSLGPKGPLSGPNYEVKAELGRQAGGNLYHSFETFNIHQGESATFSGPNSVANILSRVTGGSSSTINGLLRSTIPGADFYLINPAGVLFGPHASLDVQGSFHVGSADYIGFPDGLTFDAHDIKPPVTLSVASPESFGFLEENPEGISIQGANLKVPQNEALSIVGGDVEITDGFRPDLGVIGSLVESNGGKINIASVTSNGLVNISNSGFSIQTINPAQKSELGNINISNRSSVRVNEHSSEGVFIQGGQFILSNGSSIKSAISTSGKGGDISIDINGNVEIDSSGIISSTSGNGNSGNIQIDVGENFTINNGGEISTNSGIFDFSGKLFVGNGFAGNINIVSRNKVGLQSSRISSFTYGDGNTGQISINSPNNFNLHNSLVNTLTLGNGSSGGIILSIRDLGLINRSNISSDNFIRDINGVVTNVGNGNSGTIEINSIGDVLIGPNSQISTSTASNGNAGNVNITTGLFEIRGPELKNLFGNIIVTGISSNTGTMDIKTRKPTIGSGKAGEIHINASEGVKISGASQITTSSLEGEGGKVLIETPAFLEMNGGQIATITQGSEDAGNVEIFANMIDMQNAFIATNTGFAFFDNNTVSAGTGNAGKIFIRSEESISLSNRSKIFSSTFGKGNGGKIGINTKELTLTKGGSLVASSFGAGKGGDITINASNILITGGAEIPEGLLLLDGTIIFGEFSGIYISSESAMGSGGSLDITADTIKVNDGGVISGIAKGQGKAGNISLAVKDLMVENGGLISTSTSGLGKGGDITIQADRLVLISGEFDQTKFASFNNIRPLNVSGISSSSTRFVNSSSPELGDSGSINISSDKVNINNHGEIITNTLENGQGGDIFIRANDIMLSENGIVSSKSMGTGNAGNIGIVGAKEFHSQSSNITTESSQSDGGNITLKAKDLISLKDSSITASVKKGGNGGNIDIDPRFVVLDNSQIIAQAEDGAGGNINLTADFLFASPNSIIDASSDRGINGQVNIDAPDTDILGGLEGLPANFLDAASILSKPCAARTDLNNIRIAERDYAYEVLPQSPDVLQVHLPSLSSQTEFDHQQNVALKSSESSVMQLSALSDCHESM